MSWSSDTDVPDRLSPVTEREGMTATQRHSKASYRALQPLGRSTGSAASNLAHPTELLPWQLFILLAAMSVQ